MYVIKLARRSTNHVGVYQKHALLVCTSFDEYSSIIGAIDFFNTRVRRKQIYYTKNITELIPNNGATWILYVEYRYKEDGDWENDIAAFIVSATPYYHRKKKEDK